MLLIPYQHVQESTSLRVPLTIFPFAKIDLAVQSSHIILQLRESCGGGYPCAGWGAKYHANRSAVTDSEPPVRAPAIGPIADRCARSRDDRGDALRLDDAR